MPAGAGVAAAKAKIETEFRRARWTDSEIAQFHRMVEQKLLENRIEIIDAEAIERLEQKRTQMQLERQRANYHKQAALHIGQAVEHFKNNPPVREKASPVYVITKVYQGPLGKLFAECLKDLDGKVESHGIHRSNLEGESKPGKWWEKKLF